MCLLALSQLAAAQATPPADSGGDSGDGSGDGSERRIFGGNITYTLVYTGCGAVLIYLLFFFLR